MVTRNLVAGVIRIVVFTPLILVLYAFGTDPEGFASVVSEGTPGAVVQYVTALPYWYVVILLGAGVALLDLDSPKR